MRAYAPGAPSRALVLHPSAQDLAPDLFDALTKTYGDAVRMLPPKERRVWVQDYFPLLVPLSQGNTLAAEVQSHQDQRRQLTFLSLYPGESGFHFADVDAPAKPLNLLLSGGALKVCSEQVFVSRTVADQNRVWPRDAKAKKRLLRGGFAPRSLPELQSTLAEALGVELEQIRFLNPMPGEATGHLTSFMRPMQDGRLVVPEMREDAVEQIGFAHEIGVARLVQTFLDVRAADFAALGLDVVRLPMLPPIDLNPSARPERWVGQVHTATATLLVNMGNKRRAFLPTFETEKFPQGYRRLQARLTDEWQTFYSEQGFEPVAIDATATAQAGGSLPRLTGSIPV